MAQAEYETGNWFLMGKIWLPWVPPPSADGQGGYITRSVQAGMVLNSVQQGEK
jgi:hypothetical protein